MKAKLWFESFTLFFVPVLLIYLDILPKQQRYLWLMGGWLLIFMAVEKSKYGRKKLGIRKDNLKATFLPYLLFTLLGLIGILWWAKQLNRSTEANWWLDPHFYFWFLPVSVAQEYIFRGYLLTRQREVLRSDIKAVLSNVVVFGFIHIIFPMGWAEVLMITLGGLSFAIMFIKFPNLIWLSLSHAVLNYAAVLFCFFSLVSSC